MMENIIIFSLLFSLKNNEENKRESWEKFIGFFTAHPPPPAPVSLSLTAKLNSQTWFIYLHIPHSHIQNKPTCIPSLHYPI